MRENKFKEKTFTAVKFERINSHFYIVQLRKYPFELNESELILFRYKRGKNLAKTYGLLDFAEGCKAKKAIAVGEFLIAETIDPRLSDVLCSNGKVVDMSSGGITRYDIHFIGEQKYLFRQKNLFIEYSEQRYFFADGQNGSLKQIPLFMAFDVWNNTVFGSYVNNDVSVFCFYNLITGQRVDLPEKITTDKQVVMALLIDLDEIVIWYEDDDKAYVYDKHFNPKDVNYTYERYSNILIQRENGGLCKIINSTGRILGEFEQNTCKIECINLDNDYDGQYEAIICSSVGQMVLVNCVDGLVHCADEIEHVGLGFFRLVNEGKEEWVTF